MLLLAVLLALGSVASYLRLLMRRLTPVGARKVFGPREDGSIRPNRERVGVSISALHGAAMHLFAVGLTGLLIWRRPEHLWSDIGTALLIVLSAVAIADQLIPFLLVVRHDEPEVILEGWEPHAAAGGYWGAAPHLSDPDFHHHRAAAGTHRTGTRAAFAAGKSGGTDCDGRAGRLD